MHPDRQKIVDEALTWQRTPWHHLGRVKGAGVDCAMLLAEVYRAALPNDIPQIEVENYDAQWHLHHNEEKFLPEIAKYCKEVTGPPLPGDVIIYKAARVYSHGAIVINWPMVLHSHLRSGIVCLADVTRDAEMVGRKHIVFRLKRFVKEGI